MTNKKKNIIKILLVFVVLFCIQLCAGNNQNLRNWVIIAPNFHKEFYKTQNAIDIGDNCLAYQSDEGGFPKNYYIPDGILNNEITSYRKKLKNIKYKKGNITFDNYATTTEVIYLAKLYSQTHIQKYREGVIKGLNFIIDAQYENGGWPQTPFKQCGLGSHSESKQFRAPKIKSKFLLSKIRKFNRFKRAAIKKIKKIFRITSDDDYLSDLCISKYREYITYNDDVMINILYLLKDVSAKNYPFEFVDDNMAQRAKIAYEKGIDCILNTQIRQNNQLTVWSNQYNEKTLEPVSARSYELVAYNGGVETVNIILFLMSVDNPSNEIIQSIESAVKWFDSKKITDTKIEYYINTENQSDIRLVHCQDCPFIWARYYDLESGEPVFSDRLGVKIHDFSSIPYERRIGYDWFSYEGQKVLDEYPKWKNRLKK